MHLLGRLSFIAPMVVFVAIGVLLAAGLTSNPREIPSPLIGKPVPRFALPPVQGRALGLASADLRGEVSLVNVFASWCVACKEEHPVFMQLKREAFLPVHGINYKDRPADAAKWLDDLGDPYTRTGADLDGRVSIDWGVYGVPGGRPLAAYVLGLAFGFGWTPCIGPVLGAILTLSAVQSSVPTGVGLLAVYAAGLGVPFLLTAAFTREMLAALKRLRRAGLWLQYAAGGIMVLMGVAMMTGQLSVLSYWMLRTFPIFGRMG